MFVKPELKVIYFPEEDVIVTSNASSSSDYIPSNPNSKPSGTLPDDEF